MVIQGTFAYNDSEEYIIIFKTKHVLNIPYTKTKTFENLKKNNVEIR